MYEHEPQEKLSARVLKSHRRTQNTLQRKINNLATTSKIVDHNLDTIIHIYIYFNILLSYLNAAYSAVLLIRMIRC